MKKIINSFPLTSSVLFFPLVASLLFIVSLTSGCSSGPTIRNIEINPPHEISTPDIVTNANVGIYYEPSFANYAHKQSAIESIYIANMGKESVGLFNASIPLAFKNTQVISDLPPYDINRSELDGIIETRLNYVNWRTGFDSEEDFFHVEYTFIFYTSNGVPISTWTIYGKGEYLQDQMVDAAKKFVTNFSNAQETMRFREYLESKKVGDLGFNISDINIKADLIEERAFGLRLKDSGVLPIKITITNNNGVDIIGRELDARLIYSDGKRLIPAFPLAVISATEYMAALSAVDTDIIAGLFGPLAAIATTFGSDSSRVDERKKQLEHYDKSRFKNAKLSNGDSIQGTIYFTLPDDLIELKEATLSLWFVNPSAANGVRKEINLHGLDYVKLSPEELEQKADEREVQP